MTNGLDNVDEGAGFGETLHQRARRALEEVCTRYGIDASSVYLMPMGGRNGGLGNAIPLPLPFRRRYLLRYHRCMRDADPLALRGLFAHELMHVVHYAHASYGELMRFVWRYLLFLATAGTRFGWLESWGRALEHLTDLMAVQRGEGASLAAWKRFKALAIKRGDICDALHEMYLSSAEVDAFNRSGDELQARIDHCVAALRGRDELHPFARPAA